MRNIGAYLLLQAGGKKNPTAADIKTLLGVVGIEADEDRLNLLISELSGKSINDLIAEGSGKLASVPAGGAAGGAGGGASVAAGGPPAAEKEEEAKEEEKEESDEDMGFGLFD